MIKIQEAEGQIITSYEVYEERPSDSKLLVSAIEAHLQRLGRIPDLVAADAGFYSASGEKTVHRMGVKKVSIPNRSTKSAARRKLQKTRWFKKGQKWRTGCEGRISVLKTTARADTLSLQRRARNEALGRTRRHQRQPHQHRPRPGGQG